MLTPANSLGKFRFCTLAGVQDAELVNGEEIHGHFRQDLKEFYGVRRGRLVEDFVNWASDPGAILTFTRKFGPLECEPVAGTDFHFHLASWEISQQHFRDLWKTSKKYPDWEPKGGSLAFRKGWLTYTASNLYMFLYMDLVTCEAKRLRTCKRFDCPNPYFIAGHLRQKFCSDRCAQWGQRQWKAAWWKAHGTSWRAGRPHRKGDKNGTQKTR